MEGTCVSKSYRIHFRTCAAFALYQRPIPYNQEPIAQYAGSVDRAKRFHKDALGASARLNAASFESSPAGRQVISAKTGVNVRLVFPLDIASNAGVAFALVLLSMSNTAALGELQCDQESTLGASHIRRARASQNGVNHSSVDEKCRVVISQFVEAVTARQAAATCQNSVSRERALRIIDAEIETFNDLIGEQSCGQ